MQYISHSNIYTTFLYELFHLEPRVTVHKTTSQNTKKNLNVFTGEVNEQLKAGVKYDGGKVRLLSLQK